MTEEERVLRIIKDSFIGPFLKDKGITDISYDGSFLMLQHNEKGFIVPPTEEYPQEQPTIEQVEILMGQIADAQKKLFTHSSPELNTDVGYLRLNAVHRRVSPDGASFSLRVSRPRLAIASLSSMTYGQNEDVERLLDLWVKGRNNLVISGLPGTGKTEMQKLLVGSVNDKDKIGLVEDTRDSHIKKLYPQKHILSWQTIPGVFSLSDGVKAILRNNCKWAMIAEIRGVEAADLSDAAKTGHAVLTTLHSLNALNSPSRMIPMIQQSPAYANRSELSLGQEIIGLIPLGMHLISEEIDGKIVRRIDEIVEYTGFDEKGAKGRYVYRVEEVYNEVKGVYERKEMLNSLSVKSLEALKRQHLYHLLPEVFRQSKEGEVND